MSLLPGTAQLNGFAIPVPLEHLTGEGVLKSKYVQVMNGVDCRENFGAFDPNLQFNYEHSDRRFQEAMTYFFSDRYQAMIEEIGYLELKSAARMVVHCEERDNAYFERRVQSSGNALNRVCLGDSVKSPGAFYSDDAIVSIHELQHANTVNNYSLKQDLNQFWYDEAGAMNEAISDFMGLIYMDQVNFSSFALDARIFSRWALAKFDPEESHIRGAHLCPVYDSNYPDCGQYPAFGLPTDANNQTTTISLVYPDGLGWPYPNYYRGATSAGDTLKNYPYQEEIHDAGVLLEGALWDSYDAIKKNHQDSRDFSFRSMSKLVLESIRHLPMPDATVNLSPVNFIGLASNMVNYSQQMSEFTEADRSSLRSALKTRGLVEYLSLSPPDWMGIGPGTNSVILTTSTPGVRIEDDPKILSKWLDQMGGDSSFLQDERTAAVNSKLDPGELAALWFDIQNNSNTTAGGVLLTVTSLDPDIKILNGFTNIGYLYLSNQNQAQTMYAKVNGKAIVEALRPSDSPPALPIGNTYFTTNRLFDQSWYTAIWIRVSSQAAHGKVVNLNVKAQPSNGIAQTKNFPVTIN
jgi:hypothetical protein